MNVVINKSLVVDLPEKWKGHLSDVKDSLVIFKGETNKRTDRIITFEALGESYRMTTNRLDLKTYEIIMLYAYRWQVELFFHCFKRCFNGLHLWSHEPRGIEIQFYLYRIVYLLLLSFKPDLHDREDELQQKEADKNNGNEECSEVENKIMLEKVEPKVPKKSKITRTPACGIVTLLGEKLKTIWKIAIHWLTAIKNMLEKPMTNRVIRKLNFS